MSTGSPLSKSAVQRVRALRARADREAAGLFVVEGEKAVQDLLAQAFPFEEIYATDAWPGRATTRVSAADMRRLSHFPTPASVLALGRIRRTPLPPGALDHGLSLALDRIQDPGNLGTLLRIADWFAFDRVVLSPGCADRYSAKVIQASMGSFARVVVHEAELAAALAGVRAPVLGCDAGGEDVHALPRLEDAVVVVGSEGQGLAPALRPRLTRLIAVPRYGKAESLNAAVAAGIACACIRSKLT
jgi:TrmH family RNA methyltransferase